MSFLQPTQLIEHLTDAFERSPDKLPTMASATLAECVPLIAMALEFVGRGPAALTVDATSAAGTAADAAFSVSRAASVADVSTMPRRVNRPARSS